MQLFIDTADIAQVREAYGWGIVDGVTTNPTHVSKTGRPAKEVYKDICAAVKGPVSLETVGPGRRHHRGRGQGLVKSRTTSW